MLSSLLLAAPDISVVSAMHILGIVIGAGGFWLFMRQRAAAEAQARKQESERILAEAQDRARQAIKAAEVEGEKRALDALAKFEKDTAETRNELKAAERRLEKREDQLEKKLDVLATKEKKIENAETRLAQRETEIEALEAERKQVVAKQRDELLRVSHLSQAEAREQCLKRFEVEVEQDAAAIAERIVTEAEEQAREKARYITISAIQRYAAEHTCEAVVATVEVPSDEMKGRVIGREGRNIRAFEKVTGVTVIVDDTPGIIQVSCFDPVRKEIARQSLERLVRDGRIHPARIEELVATVTKEVDQRVTEAGREAAKAAQVVGVNKKVLDVLGRLTFRTSYGQNVLKHSVEVAYLCGLMADELGLDGATARRCGLLHDLGKALDHELEGAHTKVGFEYAKRFGEPPAVLNAIVGHHGDVAATTPYTPLVTAADAISASRPGGRRESIERYIKRLQELEQIATSFEGVTQAYAIEAGREVRVIVDAERVPDPLAFKLARDVAKKIEDDVGSFPGEIRVTVLRELRATEFAISGKHRSNGDRAAMVFEAGPEDLESEGEPAQEQA